MFALGILAQSILLLTASAHAVELGPSWPYSFRPTLTLQSPELVGYYSTSALKSHHAQIKLSEKNEPIVVLPMVGIDQTSVSSWYPNTPIQTPLSATPENELKFETTVASPQSCDTPGCRILRKIQGNVGPRFQGLKWRVSMKVIWVWDYPHPEFSGDLKGEVKEAKTLILYRNWE